MINKHYYEYLLDFPVHLLEDSYEYIEKSDAAHDERHIRAVVREAGNLCTKLEVSRIERFCVLLSALTHDLGCSIRGGRDKHEVYSAQIMQGLMAEYKFGQAREKLVTECILQHRASYTGTRHQLASKIVAAADRGRPNASLLFLRAYAYTKEVNDVDHDTAIAHAIDYNIAKYGYSGYAKMADNPVISEFYPAEAVAIEREFEEATASYVEKCLESYYC